MSIFVKTYTFRRSNWVIAVVENSVENYIEWCPQHTKRLDSGLRYDDIVHTVYIVHIVYIVYIVYTVHIVYIIYIIYIVYIVNIVHNAYNVTTKPLMIEIEETTIATGGGRAGRETGRVRLGTNGR